MSEEISQNKTESSTLELTSKQFDRISRLVYQVSGIDLHEGKEELVKARLLKRLRYLKLSNFEEYCAYLHQDRSGQEIKTMIDVLTTNKTNFFREPDHLHFLRDELIPKWGEKPVRIWSAGCSSGEEPYSIAITLCEAIPHIEHYDIRILATDISDRMMEKAHKGEYDEESLQGLSSHVKNRYFQRVVGNGGKKYHISENVRQWVKFAKLNLMDDWPMRGPFDVIFCRNVMIYFDKPTQENLIRRFWQMLRDEGYLMVGHSESLNFLDHDFLYIKPAIYQRVRHADPVHKKTVGLNRM